MAEEADNATVAANAEQVLVDTTPTSQLEATDEKSANLQPETPLPPPLTEPNPTDEQADPKEESVEVTDAAQKPNPAGEETNTAGDLPEHEVKALDELKQLIQEALQKHEFSTPATSPPPPPSETAAVAFVEKPDEQAVEEVDTEEKETVTKIANLDEDGAKTVEAIEETIVSVTPSLPQDQPPTPAPAPPVPHFPEEVSIWGIPLLKDERSDVVLWKFLRARDFKVKEAFAMIKNTIRWRKEFRIDELTTEEDVGGAEFGKVVFMHGFSKEGHPVCYNVYGGFQDKELYRKAFSDEEKRGKFLRWRVQFLERSIRKLDFRPGGISTIVQVNDLKNSPGPGKWELRQATKQALQLLQDNYPEFVAKQVFVNVPWWYVAVNKMITPFLTQRTKSKFVVTGPSRSAETLFSYIAAEQVPVQYGGLSSKGGEFSPEEGATQIIIKPGSKETVELSVNEAWQLTWEVRVLGWEVSYGAEFVPNAEDAYTVIIQKMRKVGPSEETIIFNTFKVSEPGKVVLSFDNATSKKKKLLYRLKSKPLV